MGYLSVEGNGYPTGILEKGEESDFPSTDEASIALGSVYPFVLETTGGEISPTPSLAIVTGVEV